jgi:hypothetical protein
MQGNNVAQSTEALRVDDETVTGIGGRRSKALAPDARQRRGQQRDGRGVFAHAIANRIRLMEYFLISKRASIRVLPSLGRVSPARRRGSD